jgi:acylphosphatase
MAKRVYYAGLVQGVGFRATTVSIARGHPGVRGWVRNLADGRVELLADGHTTAVERFLAEVRSYLAERIEAEDIFDHETDEPLVGFRITH